MSVKSSISWADITINPITGCLNNCSFCYARRFAHRLAGRYGYPADEPFRPTFHPDKLADIYGLAGKGKRIFLDSMSDWFSPGVDPDWINQILNMVDAVSEHTFLVLTKRPDNMECLRYLPTKVPENLWFGVSITCQKDVWRIDELVHNSPLPKDTHLFVSIEPLLGPIDVELSSLKWAIIGAETGNRKGKVIPKVAWIEDLVQDAAITDIPIFMKENLRDFYHAEPWKMIQQFPQEMKA